MGIMVNSILIMGNAGFISSAVAISISWPPVLPAVVIIVRRISWQETLALLSEGHAPMSAMRLLSVLKVQQALRLHVPI